MHLMWGEIGRDHLLSDAACRFTCLPYVSLERIARPAFPPFNQGGVLILRPQGTCPSESQRMRAKVATGQIQPLGCSFDKGLNGSTRYRPFIG